MMVPIDSTWVTSHSTSIDPTSCLSPFFVILMTLNLNCSRSFNVKGRVDTVLLSNPGRGHSHRKNGT